MSCGTFALWLMSALSLRAQTVYVTPDGAGLGLLQVSSPTRHQTVEVLKSN
ncbi:hypothetical protein [Spirosoma fluviale]|uniref:hypothetical protein n=1 Tax=Spirosoma fluviale TaxID=1597977 RepID=UPI0015C97BAA|nr:hypothetical protein [Spirosoma fluviale]